MRFYFVFEARFDATVRLENASANPTAFQLRFGVKNTEAPAIQNSEGLRTNQWKEIEASVIDWSFISLGLGWVQASSEELPFP
jgi:hypothetical protein